MTQFIKVNGILINRPEGWKRTTMIININEIKSVEINEQTQEAHIKTSDFELSTSELDKLNVLIENEDNLQEKEKSNMSLIEFCNAIKWPRYRERVYQIFMRNGIRDLRTLIDLGQVKLKQLPGVGQGAYNVITITATENGIDIPRIGKRD